MTDSLPKKTQSDETLKRISKALKPVKIFDGDDQVKKEGQRRAAVLMPLIARSTGWQVLLTQRPKTMRRHAGQISFPGGRAELGESAYAAALRETHEEVGIAPESVSVMGRLDSFSTVSDFRVTPFVGVVNPNVPIIACPQEVDEAFEVPLSFFMDSDNHQAREVEFKGTTLKLWDMPYTGPDGTMRNVWGMTAMMLYRLYRRAYVRDFTHADPF